MTGTPGDSIVAALTRRAALAPDRVVLRYLDGDGQVRSESTYRQLLDAAHRAAGVLTEAKAAGEPVILLARADRDFLEWFLGCQLAGAIAVPMPPATGRNRIERVAAAAGDCGARLVVGRHQPGLARALPALDWIGPQSHRDATAGPHRDVDVDRWPLDVVLSPQRVTPAALQYTSGSTSRPRGVVLTDACLLDNVSRIGTTFALDHDDDVLVWLPPHHDMGLIGGLLTPLLHGISCTVLDPADFARSPLLWLTAMDAWRTSVSGGPNAAFETLARVLEQPVAADLRLDLSRWRVAFVGAEPVQAATLARFGAAAARFGFDPAALRPCYGLAEATLMVTCAPRRPAASAGSASAGSASAGSASAGSASAGSASASAPPDLTRPVACGPPIGGTEIRIVDPDGRPVPAGTEGEVLVRGPGVAAGYWQAPDATEEVFRATVVGEPGTFLRTGDLGFVDGDGALVPTGRARDLLIVHGRNLYPADLELAALRALEPRAVGLAAAVHLDTLDEIAVFVECGADDTATVVDDLYARVAAAAEHPPALVATVRLGTLPRTTSGKIQRGRTRERHLAGRLATTAVRHRAPDAGEHRRPDGTPADAGRPEQAPAVRARLAATAPSDRVELIIRYVAERLGVPADQDPTAALAGLDSLRRMALLAELELVAGAPLSHAVLLDAGSATEVAAQVVAAWTDRAGPAGGQAGPVLPAPDQWHPAGPAESAMYLLEQVQPGGTTLAAGCDIDGAGADEIAAAVEALVHRHAVLRTGYRAGPDGVLRRTVDKASPVVTVTDGSGWTGPQVDDWLRRVADVTFDLAQPPLLRAALLRRSPRRQLLVLCVPHVVADFPSLTVILSDLLRALAGEPAGPVPAPYQRHLAEQEQYGSGPAATAARDHFTRILDRVPARLGLPGPAAASAGVSASGVITPGASSADTSSADTSSADTSTSGASAADDAAGRAAEVDAALDPATAALVTRFARRTGTTPFTVLLALCQAVLHRRSGQPQLAVAVPMAGRTDPRYADTVGLFMNQVPMVSRCTAGTSFADLVRAAHQQVRDGLDHQRYPAAAIADQVGVAGRGATALFEAMFVYYQSLPGQPAEFAGFPLGAGEPVRAGAVTVRPVRVRQSRDTLPLTLLASGDERSGIRFVLRYLPDRIAADVVAELADLLPRMAARLLADPAGPVLTADPAGPAPPIAATAPVVADAVGPVGALGPVRAVGPDDRSGTVVDRLWHCVRRYPQRTAVRDDRQALTYRELWERAGRVAAGLAARGVGPGDLVALLHTRDTDAIVATIGVLRSGAAYVHLGLDNPAPRLRRIVTDCAPRVVLTCTRRRADAAALGPPVVTVAGLAETAGADPAGADPAGAAPAGAASAGAASAGAASSAAAPLPPSATAYVSYTSGSAGQPKGVVVSHGAVVRATDAYADQLGIGPGDVVAGVSSLGWDIVVGDLFGALLRAATLCVVPDPVAADGATLARFLGTVRATVLATTPHRWRLLLDAGYVAPPGFRAVCGGDAMSAADAERFRLHGIHVWNFYGPTETVLWSHTADLWRWNGNGHVPIGRDLPGYHSVLLDEAFRPVPASAAGELCVGGGTVADGYLGDPRSTAERFVPDPFAARPGARLYRTGDLARRQGDDGLVFVGRGDSQVKLRGYRIELGEVDAALVRQPGVVAAATTVLPDPGGLAELVAFVVADSAVDRRDLVAGVARILPRHMVPTRVQQLPALPVNANGKLDRQRLAALPRTDRESAGAALRTPTEQLVAAVMAELVGAASVHADDDFFLIGGHSLRAVQLAARLTERTGRPVSVRDVLGNPQVSALARLVDSRAPAVRSPAEDAVPPPTEDAVAVPSQADLVPDGPSPTDGATVTPGQYRLWFDHVAGTGEPGMILPFLVELRGRVDPAAVRSAFDDLVDRHESLRTVVVTRRGEPRQVPGPRPELEILDATDPTDPTTDARRVCAALLAQQWALADGPLLRARLLVAAPDHALLVLAVHHAIFDGWSARVLLEEFRQLYAAARTGRPAELMPLPVPERQAAALIDEGPAGPAGEEIVRQVAAALAGAPRLHLSRPADQPAAGAAADRPAGGPAAGGPAADKHRRVIGDLAHRAGRRHRQTAYAAATTALLLTLRRRCGQDDLVTGLDLANRHRAELEPLVGYFGNQLPVRVDLGGVGGFTDAAARVRDALATALDRQWLGYERVVAQLRRDGVPTGTGLFDVKIVHQYVARAVTDPTGEVEFRLLDSGWASPANPVGLWIWDDGAEVVLELHHRLDACTADWAQQVLDEVIAVLRTAADDSEEVTVPVDEPRTATAGEDFPAFDDIEIVALDAEPEAPPAAGGGVAEPGAGRTRVDQAGRTRVAVVEATGRAVDWFRDHPASWRDALAEYGALLLRGCQVDAPEPFAQAVAEVFDAPYATTEHPRQVLSDRVVMPIDYPAELELYWHNEDSFNRTFPGTIAFACQRPADVRGATTVVDGVAVLDAMPSQVRERFARTGVSYVRRFLPGLGLPWTTVFGTDDRAEVQRRCAADDIEAAWDGDLLTTTSTRPAVLTDGSGRASWFAQILHWHEYCLDPQTRRDLDAALGGVLPRSVTYGDGTPIPDEVVAELIAISRANEWAAPWRQGDLLLIDNVRMAHGRQPYQGERRIMVSLGDPRRP